MQQQQQQQIHARLRPVCMCARSRPNAIAVCGLCNWLSGNMVHLTQTLAVDEAKSAESSISTASTVQEKLHVITRSTVYFWLRRRAIISNLNQTTISAFCRLSILFRCSFFEKKTRSERRQNVLFLKMPMHKRRKRKTEQRNMSRLLLRVISFCLGFAFRV